MTACRRCRRCHRCSAEPSACGGRRLAWPWRGLRQRRLLHASARSGDGGWDDGILPGAADSAGTCGGLPLEGDSRVKWCMALANQLEAARQSAELSRVIPSALLGDGALSRLHPPCHLPCFWTPSWTALRDRDAFPGQDVCPPVHHSLLALAKKTCKARGLAGIVTWGSAVFVRPQRSADELRSAAQPASEVTLLLRGGVGAETPDSDCYDKAAAGKLRVAILATQDEFEETACLEHGVVSSTGNGRRYAAHALIRSVLASAGMQLTALLVYDWKSEDQHLSRKGAPLPIEGPTKISVAIRGYQPVAAWWGTWGQLVGCAAGDLQVDVGISIQARRSSVELLRLAVSAARYVVMGHDYNLPYGPWGLEVQSSEYCEHRDLLEGDRVHMFCTSRHLTDLVCKYSGGNAKAQLCYCADYGYFDRFDSNGLGLDSLPALCPDGDCVAFISPCPAKGLPVVLRLALMLEDVRFLCVCTGWTKTHHEVQMLAHQNIEIVKGSEDLDAVYRRSAVVLLPSLWAEAFGLVAVEAQLRGVPVVSTAACGLLESNFLPELQVRDVMLVHDSRTREMLRGITMVEAEKQLDCARSAKSAPKDQAIGLAHTLVATEGEAAGFAALVRRLIDDTEERRRLGAVARERAIAHIQGRRGMFDAALQELVADAKIKAE